ncbi:hypothetical protein [Alienimonas sp. DA493]|uniref:hypothetical protein n=1 Tax=Alienimonas sp. DA493 TaxID=3373605 RepID=UPI003754E1A8
MTDVRPLPTALKVVAWLFIITGALAAWDVLAALLNGRISLNFGVLGLFIGPGLLRLSSGWRTCGLVLLWIEMILIPLAILALVASGGPLDVTLSGEPAGEAPLLVGLGVVGALLALVVWEYRVLTRPDVRRLFELETDRTDPLANVD